MNPQYMPQHYGAPIQNMPANAPGQYPGQMPPNLRPQMMSAHSMPPPPGPQGPPQNYGVPPGPPQQFQSQSLVPPQNTGIQKPPQMMPGNQNGPSQPVSGPPPTQNGPNPTGPPIIPPPGQQFSQKPPIGSFQNQLPPPPNVSQGPPQIIGQMNQPHGPPRMDNDHNQLSNQMSGLNINPQSLPQSRLPGGPIDASMPPMVNGNHGGPPPPIGAQYPPQPIGMPNQQMPSYDRGPHMPPPLAQQPGMPPLPNQMGQRGPPGVPGQFVNGSQQANVMQQRPPAMGYPPQPQPGMPPMPGNIGGPYPQPGYPQQPQQAKRLDPDQMPSPIQVMLDDQKTRSGVFCTNQKGLMPPLVTTDFITQDQGNCSPRYIRSTMYNVPITMDMMKQTAVPFGLVISPLARTVDQEYPPPIVNFGELGPVRCIRCKSYMCPFMQFIDSGRRFQCLFCKATTEVPAEYFQHLDHTGQRVDRYERPELILGTYEFVATEDYCRNNTIPKPPAMIFVIDVSYNNIKSGLVNLLCSEMKSIIKHLPVDQGQEKSNMKVGFITYNNKVHFYNIKGSLAQPQMLVVGDVQEMFMPLLDGFLCDIEESEAVIDSLMEQIPNMFSDTRETETILAPAIQAGLEALKASECAGKLLVFHSSLPIAEAPGKLKNRDDRKLLGTEKEKTVLGPQNNVYNNLGQECVAVGCSVDLFIFNNSYVDIATIGQIARLTGGEVYKYTYFQAEFDGFRLVQDIKNNISRPIAFDAIMRVRTSTGVRATDFYGHFFMSNTTDVELASIDCDKGVAIEIKHDDKLTEEDGVYIQTALLYTSCSGQRRLRILNLSLKTCSQMADLYRSCDLDTIINFFSKQACYKLLDTAPKSIKDGLVQRCAQTLACYRKHCASPSSAGQLILPECMKLMPLYLSCLLKNDALSGGSDMTLDDRAYVMQAVMTMDVPTSVMYFYPRLIPLHDIDVNSDEVPPPLRCTIEKMMDNGVYILENGIHMFLWIGFNTSSEWIQGVFGVPSSAQINTDLPFLPVIDTPLSNRIRSLIETIRSKRRRCMRLTVIRQRDKLESVLKHFLVEDRGVDGSSSYVDFLCHLHKEIRSLLS